MNKNKKYYVIKQSIPYQKINLVKIDFPCNITHLKKLISFMVGKIEVFLYDDFDNSRIDLSFKLGVLNFNILDIYNFNQILKVTLVFSHFALKDKYISFYSLYTSNVGYQIPLFYIDRDVFKYKKYFIESSCRFLCSIDEYENNKNAGSTYESFISKKYVDLGYEVLLNGINKSFDDGGIDIVATKDNNVVLIQCKNWVLSNNYKINQKDLRAFVGDCFLYVKKYKYFDKKISYHFIVSHDNILTGSAEIFLKENSFIKFKCVPFEKNI